jgi:DNA-binding NarL/FixJ family response regulator
MKILLVNDHTLIREGIRYFVEQLADDITILEADTCARVDALLREHPDVDIILFHARMPGSIAATAFAEVRDRRPSVRIVVLSASTAHSDVAFALEHGAMGYIPTTVSGQVLLGALRLVLAGGIYIPPELLGKDRQEDTVANTPEASDGSRIGRGPNASRPRYLTPRQTQVFALLASGKSNKTIARELDMAVGTVKTHVTAILKALNATNRTQAAAAAHRDEGFQPSIPATSRAYRTHGDWGGLAMQ